ELIYCEKIGDFGVKLIEEIAKNKNGKAVNILTHCNAGWLACVDWGTATAPMYKAQIKGIPIHIWVDETRPRNQGARLTAWEMESAGIPYTLIPDNTGGHLMQHGMVDLVLVGSDRTTRNGDVANKIGTYLKALAAYDNQVPFYVALPSTSIDFEMTDGVKNIPIEERDGDEIKKMECLDGNETKEVLLMPEHTKVANYGFDVTPAKYVTGIITERGICNATEDDILKLFPEKR
ncbi:MAG: S-methyl-5-thioribose-1-phosphate isomerase, partial [Salinivirgaceae bacterium]|nr:S-methyl-5-thioribose-1-phosphate isomerase [Salinivirgaceae bacterium]